MFGAFSPLMHEGEALVALLLPLPLPLLSPILVPVAAVACETHDGWQRSAEHTASQRKEKLYKKQLRITNQVPIDKLSLKSEIPTSALHTPPGSTVGDPLAQCHQRGQMARRL